MMIFFCVNKLNSFKLSKAQGVKQIAYNEIKLTFIHLLKFLHETIISY